VVARAGIEPSTRGFSRRRRARLGASKPKKRNEFSTSRPNRLARPSPYRTGAGKSCLSLAVPHPGQRLAGVATELFPNRAPNGAAPGSGSLALTTSRPAARFTTLQSGRCTVNNDPKQPVGPWKAGVQLILVGPCRSDPRRRRRSAFRTNAVRFPLPSRFARGCRLSGAVPRLRTILELTTSD